MSFDSRFDAHIAAPNPPTNNKLTEHAGDALIKSGYAMVSRDTAASTLPPLDIVPTDVAGSCRADAPCARFRPDAGSQSDSAREWRQHAGEQKSNPVITDQSGQYTVKPGDSLEGIAERLAHQRGENGPGAIKSIEKELLLANKKEHPELGCNPHYLRWGQKLNLPHQSGWADSPSHGFTPADQGPVRGGIAGPGSDTSKPAPSTTDKTVPGATDKTAPGATDKPAHGPADKDKTGQSDICKPGSNLREKVIANGKALSHEELTGALNILGALKRGDDRAVEKELSAFKNNPEGMKHMADALRPALAEAGIDVNYQHIDDIRTGETIAYLHLYHHGAPHDLEIGPGGADAGDAFTRGGQTYFEGPARIGNGIMSSVMKDLRDALNKNECKVSK